MYIVVLGWLSLFLAGLSCWQMALMDRMPETRAPCSCAFVRPFVPWRRRGVATGKQQQQQQGVAVAVAEGSLEQTVQGDGAHNTINNICYEPQGPMIR